MYKYLIQKYIITSDIATAINVDNPPDVNNNTRNKPVSMLPQNLLSICFLLGVLSSKWFINHNRKRIRVHLPESKRTLAETLQKRFGGTITTVKRKNQSGVSWQATSDTSLRKIKQAVQLAKHGLPDDVRLQINGFLDNFI